MSWNGFGDEGALAVGKALETNTFLDELDLSSNRIGPDSCVGLSKSLRINTNLKTLAVSKHFNN